MKSNFDIQYVDEALEYLNNIKATEKNIYDYIVFAVYKSRLFPDLMNNIQKVPSVRNLYEIRINYNIYDFILIGFFNKSDELIVSSMICVKVNDNISKSVIDKVVNYQKNYSLDLAKSKSKANRPKL